ncbi:MAG TPA: translation initiation factor IF-2 [Thermodesulfobacteriota bacterium]|nr:translation initiation factor IF-2 [Thermodesulfobacteriota bacterium]
MPDKDVKKDKPEVEEKRLKTSVIRRRKAEAPEKPPEKEEEASKGAPAPTEPKAEEKPAIAAKKGKKELKEEKAGAGRAKGEKKKEKAGEEKRAQEAAPLIEEKKIPAEKPVIIEEKPPERPSKKEVKVFGKEAKAEKVFYNKQLFRKGGKRFEVRGGRSKQTSVQHGRALKKTEITVTKAEKKVIRIVDAIAVADFSQRLGVKAGDIIKKLMGLGIMATVNQLIDIDAATLVAADYGFEVESAAIAEESLMEPAATEPGAGLKPRPPVVTVMGHVDHGKTSLLDAIRRTNVASAEAGGITQHIGAYHVHLDRGDITFLDTPGHEAFTAMRARGAKVTDIVVLVVAADDGVMPQTIEAINHAKAANVPIIVAVNKIDLPQAAPQKIKQALTEYGLVHEDWGGDTIFVEVSAKKNIKIKELLELILIQAEMLELKASDTAPAKGVIIEAKLDKGRGPVSTVLVQSGRLEVGDVCVAGFYFGRIRAMVSDWGKRINEAGPSMPVEIVGLSGVPQAGDTFMIVKDEATARQIASLRLGKQEQKDKGKTAKVGLQDLYEKIAKGEVKELNLVIKSDVQGSIEAVKEALGKIQSEKIGLKIIHGAVGGINEGDVMLASASNAIIIGFNVRPEPKGAQLAEAEGVDIRLYTVIYNLVDDIKNAMTGLLAPIVKEEVAGRASVREVFKISKVGTVAGCYVTDGRIPRGARVRLIRDSVPVYDGKIAALKRFKDDVKEVQTGFECGISIEGYNDIKAGDVIEAYELKEEAAKL